MRHCSKHSCRKSTLIWCICTILQSLYLRTLPLCLLASQSSRTSFGLPNCMHIFSAPARPVWPMESEPKERGSSRSAATQCWESLCEGVMNLSTVLMDLDCMRNNSNKTELPTDDLQADRYINPNINHTDLPKISNTRNRQEQRTRQVRS